MVPEVGEENEEDDSINPDEVDEDWELVATGGHKVVLGDVDRDEHKLQLGAETSIKLLGGKQTIEFSQPT